MILQSVHLRSKYAARCMTYVETYMIARDDLIALAMRYPATLKLIRRSAFRLGFRREMIRRAQDSIKKRNERDGIKVKESQADKMLVAVSSRKLDEEEAKQEVEGREQLNNAFTGDEGDTKAGGAPLPPLVPAAAAGPPGLSA